IEALDPKRLRALSDICAGDFLEGLEIERSSLFTAWVTAQRRRLRGKHIAILDRLVKTASGDEAFGYLEKSLQLAPFDQKNHELLLEALVQQGRLLDGEEHVAA